VEQRSAGDARGDSEDGVDRKAAAPGRAGGGDASDGSAALGRRVREAPGRAVDVRWQGRAWRQRQRRAPAPAADMRYGRSAGEDERLLPSQCRARLPCAGSSALAKSAAAPSSPRPYRPWRAAGGPRAVHGRSTGLFLAQQTAMDGPQQGAHAWSLPRPTPARAPGASLH
jgi:hypothetical protein